jgi:hypothetical protein
MMTHSITTLRIMTPTIMAVNKTASSIMPLSIMAFNILTLDITVNNFKKSKKYAP